MQENPAPQTFDRKFVFSACLIGLGYVAIIVVVGWLFGKESAGVASIALTALGMAIFRQFETLRFKTLAQEEGRTVLIPSLSITRIALICFAFTGATFMIVGAIGAILSAIGIFPHLGTETTFDLTPLITNRWVLYTIYAIKLLVFFLVGYLVANAFNLSLYSDVTIGALSAIAVPDVIQIASAAITAPEHLGIVASGSLFIATFWAAYIVSALAGTVVGVRAQRPQQNTGR